VTPATERAAAALDAARREALAGEAALARAVVQGFPDADLELRFRDWHDSAVVPADMLGVCACAAAAAATSTDDETPAGSRVGLPPQVVASALVTLAAPMLLRQLLPSLRGRSDSSSSVGGGGGKGGGGGSSSGAGRGLGGRGLWRMACKSLLLLALQPLISQASSVCLFTEAAAHMAAGAGARADAAAR
jgi:uncharacterized membrane protein YgcG